MIETCHKLVEWTSLRHDLGIALGPRHAHWLRGAVAQRARRVEFHQHGDEGLIYRHPLIRYDASTGQAVVAGLAEGALLLRGMPAFDSFLLGSETFPVVTRSVDAGRTAVGPSGEMIRYGFRSSYLALNQENHEAWERGHAAERRRLLQRIVVGNLLSLSKGIGLHVAERLEAEVDLEPSGWQELKPGVRLLGFQGTFRVNYQIPDGWGIGKSSSRGFGTLTREEG